MFAKQISQTGAFTALLIATVLVTAILLAVGDGNPVVALAPMLAALLAIALWRLPIRYFAHTLLFLGLLSDNPAERPGRNLYHSPLSIPGALLYQPLSKSLKLPGVKLIGMEALMIVLLCIIGLRVLSKSSVDGRFHKTAAPPLLRTCLLAIGTLAFLWIYGIGRGGSMPHSILQMRTMFFMPIMTLFFAYAFKKNSDISLLLCTFLMVGFTRACVCIYYYLTFMRFQPGGQTGDGSYVTTHSDTILAAVAVCICVVMLYQHPSVKSMILLAVVVPVVGLGIVMNNRRIAFVAVAMGCFFSYNAAGRLFKRRVHQTIFSLLPFLLVYVAVGWQSHGGWAKPVQSLKSVVQQKDTSSATRDVENFNLLQTLRPNPVLGSGFGHEYLEIVKAFDISAIFEAYRYVPHNSILWFWGVGGVVGYTLYSMFISVGVFLAARICRFAKTHQHVIMAMTAISAVISYSSQCFGDMGLMSWMGSLLVSSTLGICGSLAVQVGALQPLKHNPVAARASGRLAVQVSSS